MDKEKRKHENKMEKKGYDDSKITKNLDKIKHKIIKKRIKIFYWYT